MSDDEADPELLELLRKSLGLDGGNTNSRAPETKVLENAQYIFDNSIDVALSPSKTKEAAETIWRLMQKKEYSTQTWAEHELHPKTKDESTLDFIFAMDLLNFSFWSEEQDESKRFGIEYRGKKWTGYWSLVAALQRALDEDIPITSPSFWVDEEECSESVLKHVFRSATDEEIPLFQERVQCLREAGQILCDEFDGSFVNCIYDANQSAAGLVNLLADHFPCFRDEATFHGKKVRLYKRAQILVADIWACFNGESYGEFHDIDKITMFADYRIPQMLFQLGCLLYSPPLESRIRRLQPVPSGSDWEIELRGTSIWCVELIRREIERRHSSTEAEREFTRNHGTGDPDTSNYGADADHPPDVNANDHSANSLHLDDDERPPDLEVTNGTTEKNVRERASFKVNAILIDFFLYDTMKSLEREKQESIPHHRTRSIWY